MKISSKVRKVTAGLAAAAVIMLGVTVAAGRVLAQSPTPTAPAASAAPSTQSGIPGVNGIGPGLNFFGGTSLKEFDAAAKALNLTPVQLFEQLDAGKTLQEVATAQGVNLQTVQTAVNAIRVQAQKDAINQAVKNGQMTQAQADWWLQGIANGYVQGRPGGFGRGGHGGGPGMGRGAPAQAPAPSATPGTTS